MRGARGGEVSLEAAFLRRLLTRRPAGARGRLLKGAGGARGFPSPPRAGAPSCARDPESSHRPPAAGHRGRSCESAPAPTVTRELLEGAGETERTGCGGVGTPRPALPGTAARARSPVRTWPPRAREGPARPRRPHSQAGVVAVGRQRGLHVVSQLRVHEQVVLALVAPRASPGRHGGRAAPLGPERGRALVHGGDARLTDWLGSRSWRSRLGNSRGDRVRRGPRRPGAPRARLRLGAQTPRGLSYARGCPTGPGSSRHVAGHQADGPGPLDEVSGAPGPSEPRRGGGRLRSLRAESPGDRAGVTMSTETLQPSAPAFFPRALRHDPTFKGIGTTFQKAAEACRGATTFRTERNLK